jgi:hypothetical protein
MTDVHEVKKAVLVFAEMGDLVHSMDEQEEEAEGHAERQDGDIEGVFGILCGEEFFHLRFGISQIYRLDGKLSLFLKKC